MAQLRIGTAGWVVPKEVAGSFPDDGPHLQRYAARLNAAEINSSFHRPHRRTTYQRWAASVPPSFRFAVKLPRTISHAPSADDQAALIDRFASEALGLGDKLALVLVQFPPKRSFDAAAAEALFERVAAAIGCPIVCEPRHASWFSDTAEELLVRCRVARVAADPARVAAADAPGGWPGLRYWRLHGSPVIYRSSYDAGMLTKLREQLNEGVSEGIETWCIFDNTASSAAAGNALTLTLAGATA